MKKPVAAKEIELHPDAWERFERAAGGCEKSAATSAAREKEKNEAS
jgi:hypothetical protein